MNKLRVLLVEDEADQRQLVALLLQQAGYIVQSCASAEEALNRLEVDRVDVVLSDWKLPGISGADLLSRVREQNWPVAFVMVTAYGSIERAVEAIRQGADDYITKPFEREQLLLCLQKALKTRNLANENQRLTQALDQRERLVDLIGKSPGMQRVFRTIEKIAQTDATVLISGESGTGKELTARAIHSLSKRKSGAFMAINCAAIPEGLIESEFFGAERGAFTGADRTRAGTFEAANQGTLFLDEIGELPLPIQPKLLRALQDQQITRVGGTRSFAVDVRIIAATNRDLDREVHQGRFREDLFYRLNVVRLNLPALRDRREDIPVLAQHLLSEMAQKHGLPAPVLPKSVLRALVDYHWPGNVRELANSVERMVLFAEEGVVQMADLPQAPVHASAQPFLIPNHGMNWEDHERECLRQALDRCHGNRSKAARLLGLPYKAFLYRLEKYQLAEEIPK